MYRRIAVPTLVFFASLTACRHQLTLHVETGPQVSCSPPCNGQPVMIGLYPIADIPDGLESLECSTIANDAATQEYLDSLLMGSIKPVSVIPDSTEKQSFQRKKGAQWLFVVPYFEDRCDISDVADEWALLRTHLLRRHIYLELDEYDVTLPWDTQRRVRRRWRQRGCVEGNPHRVYWQACR